MFEGMWGKGLSERTEREECFVQKLCGLTVASRASAAKCSEEREARGEVEGDEGES